MKKDYFRHHTAIIEKGARIGKGTRVWAFAHIQTRAVIGQDCNIGNHCYVEKGAKIGNRVTIKNGVSVWDGVTIEDDVFIGPNASLTNDLNPRSRKKNWRRDKTLVRRGATIGANATLLCGLEIGSYALIGAGSVVTKDVPRHALVLGNPGKIAGRVCFCGHVLEKKGRGLICEHCRREPPRY